MILVKTGISLDNFILKTLSTSPETLTIEPLQDWVANLQLSTAKKHSRLLTYFRAAIAPACAV